MDEIIKTLPEYVKQKPPVCGDAQAVMEQLYWIFMENHRIDNDKTREYYAVLQKQVKLSMREYDEVLYTVLNLSLEYGRIAFMEGLKIGMLLTQEMAKE